MTKAELEKAFLKMTETMVVFKAELEELEIMSTPPVLKGFFIPKIDECYYYVRDTGYVGESTFDCVEADKFRLAQGNCYKYEKEACEALDRLNDLGQFKRAFLQQVQYSNKAKAMLEERSHV